jgi:hypothetical protein
MNRAARRLGHPASIPRAIMSQRHSPSVPPLSRRRYADPPAGASFCCLRFAPALFSDSLQERAVGRAEARWSAFDGHIGTYLALKLFPG